MSVVCSVIDDLYVLAQVKQIAGEPHVTCEKIHRPGDHLQGEGQTDMYHGCARVQVQRNDFVLAVLCLHAR